jgi:hypothetical protein
VARSLDQLSPTPRRLGDPQKGALNLAIYGAQRPAKTAGSTALPRCLLTRKRTEVQLLPRPLHRPDQRIYCSKESSVGDGSQPPRNIPAREAAQRYKSALLLNFLRSGQAGPLPVARSFERHPRAGNRSERTITTHPDRPAPSQHLPCATRPCAVRAFAADAFAREAHRSAMLCPRAAYGSATGREGAAPRRRGEGAHGATVKARIAVRTRSFKSNPIENPTPRWQVVGQPVAGPVESERTSTAPPKR